MVRLIENKDFNDLRYIWKESWLNTLSEIDYFFKCFPKPTAVVNEENGILTSFALFVEASYVTTENSDNVLCLFRCATLTEYRKRGYMTNIIAYANELCRKSKYEGIVVVPNTDKLTSFFRNRGFNLFTQKKVVVMEYSKLNTDLKLATISCHQLQTTRRRAFRSNGLLWSINYANYVINQFSERGQIFCSFSYYNLIGTLMGSVNNSMLIVDEITLKMQHNGRVSKINMQDITNGLCNTFNVTSVSYSLPERSEVLGKPIEASYIMSDKLTYSPDKYVFLGL